VSLLPWGAFCPTWAPEGVHCWQSRAVCKTACLGIGQQQRTPFACKSVAMVLHATTRVHSCG
jgi:hypothetical protein